MIDLPNPVRQLLAELELLSHGKTQSWNSTGGKGESETVLPFGELHPPHITLRALYLRQYSDSAKQRVIQRMRDELNDARGHVDRSHVTGESREQEDERIIKQGEGFTAEEVALRFNCTPTRVRRARAKAERTVELGKPCGDPVRGLHQESRRRKALEYHEQGMTLNQIGRLLGCDKATISRDLRAA